MSYSNSFPTQRPSLNLVFNGGSDQLDSRISFSRADTPPTYAAPSAVHYWSNEKHLSTENLLPYSNDLSQSAWSKLRTTVLTTNNLAPDGSNSASSLVEQSTTGEHSHYYAYSVTAGTTYSHTLFAKANGRSVIKMGYYFISPSQVSEVEFDLVALTATVLNGTVTNESITDVGNGWRKLTFSTVADSNGTAYFQNYFSNGSSYSYAGDTSKGAFLWRHQASSTGQTVVNQTSGSIHREYSSTLKSVANAGDPRFEYSPADGQSVGLLIEAQSTNYLLKSEDIAGWSSPANMTVSANAMVAPNGTLTADVLTVSDDTVASGHFAYRSSSAGTSGETVAVSFFAKSAGVNQIYFYDNGVGAASVSIFDLSNGTIGGANASNSKMIDCGNGWYRCVSAYTLTGTGEQLRFYTYNGTSTTYIANGFDGFALWGVQVEQASSESSYIGETVSSTITRASDSCSVALDGILADGQDVTLYAEGDFGDPDVLASNRIAAILQKDSSNYIMLYNGVGNSGTGYINYGGVSQADWASGVTTGEFKAAISAKPNSLNYAANGIAGTEDTSGTVPNYNSLHLGSWYTGSLGLDGTLKRVAVYGQALSSTELAALTS